jgi:hypothetical protein
MYAPQFPTPPPGYMPYVSPRDYKSLTTSPLSPRFAAQAQPNGGYAGYDQNTQLARQRAAALAQQQRVQQHGNVHPPIAASLRPRDKSTLRKVMGLDDRSSRRGTGRQPILPGVRADASTRLRSIKTPSQLQPDVTKYSKEHSESRGRVDTSWNPGPWEPEPGILRAKITKNARSRSRHALSYSDLHHYPPSPESTYEGMTPTQSTPASRSLGPAEHNRYLISQEQSFGSSIGSTPSQGSAYHQTQAAKAQAYVQGHPPAMNPAQAQQLQMQRRKAQLAPMNATNQSVHDQPLKSPNPFPNKIIHANIQVQSIEEPKAQFATMDATNQSVHEQPPKNLNPLPNKIIHADIRIQSMEEPGGNTDEQLLPILDFEKVELASTGPKSSYSSYSNNLLDSGATRLGGSMYRGNTYSLDPSPVGSYSVSSASSLSGGPVEGPDIERALSNWTRHQHRQGLPLSDVIIRDKAHFFAQTVGNSGSYLKANSTSWLENFKQKNQLMDDQHMVPSHRTRRPPVTHERGGDPASRGGITVHKPRVTKADRVQMEQEKQWRESQAARMEKTALESLPAINTQRPQIRYTVSDDQTNTFQRHKAQFVALRGARCRKVHRIQALAEGKGIERSSEEYSNNRIPSTPPARRRIVVAVSFLFPSTCLK